MEKTKYILKHPEELIMMDEVGSNTNMKMDGNKGGARVISKIHQKGHQEAIKTDIHYTVLGLTAANGEPVCCVAILPSKAATIPSSWVTGINIAAFVDGDEDEDICGEIALSPTVLEEFFEKNVFVGGPTCTFLGKEIPCLVKISPHGGIDADILVDILRHLDQLELFKHTRQQGHKPFLLVDGHQSRMDLKFIDYLQN